MTVHDNYLDGYEVSQDLDPETVTVDRFGQMQIRGFWGGGVSYLMWPLAYGKKHLEDPMRRIQKLGIRGPFYPRRHGFAAIRQSSSATSWIAHADGSGNRSPAADGEADLRLISATETGFLYCSLTPDLVANPGNDHLLSLCRPEWPITGLLTRCVPLWNLVMSGLVVTENQGLSWPDTMRALLNNQQAAL